MALAQFRDQGFYLAKNIISPEILAGIRHVLADALGRPKNNPTMSLDDLILLREQEDHDLVYQASLCVGSSATAYQLIASKAILDLISTVGGIDLRSLHIMPFAIQAQLPNDRRFDTIWHQESPAYPWCPDVLSIWFPIVRPSKASEGTMVIIPGSHRDGLRESVSSAGHNHLGYKNFRQMEVPLSASEIAQGVPVEINLGDVCIFDSNVVHCSAPNLASVPRVAGILRIVNFANMPKPRPLYKMLTLSEVSA